MTADPELRHTSSDTAVTSFTVAVDRSYVKLEQSHIDFIDVVVRRSTAGYL
ncbi:MAG: single-stranded DNA-binding protein [Anaeromassilibacillus sp.]